jgi:formate-dependent nitrite reductase membrane component NrfD
MEIGIYLFLGGLVAGMMIITGYLILSKKAEIENSAIKFTPIASIISLSLGMFALFLDLEHKLFVWRMYTTFQWSAPMSWGAWILLLVYPILLITTLIWLPGWLRFNIFVTIQNTLKSYPKIKNIIAYLNMSVGASLGIYTGILLSAFVARPAWNSSILWLLFLVSGLSTAAAFIHLFGKNSEEKHLLAKADNALLVAELLVILLLFVGFLGASEVQVNAAKMFLGGAYTAPFWVFVVGLGIVIPLILQLYSVKDRIKHTKLIPIFVLTGGLILRFIIVAAGQASHWSTSVFK